MLSKQPRTAPLRQPHVRSALKLDHHAWLMQLSGVMICAGRLRAVLSGLRELSHTVCSRCGLCCPSESCRQLLSLHASSCWLALSVRCAHQARQQSGDTGGAPVLGEGGPLCVLRLGHRPWSV